MPETLENLTLSESELEACRPTGSRQSAKRRAFCPFHGSDKQRSLSVDTRTGRFSCFACGAWGYLDWAREQYQRDRTPSLRSVAPSGRRSAGSQLRRPPPAPPGPAPELGDALRDYQAALPGSPGETYLRERGIPLELAQAYGLGYAAPGRWAHRSADGRPLRDWPVGRVVIPHTNPAGEVVNLYGRAVGDAPKELRHDHLPGAKGYFNAPALLDDGEPLAVCEGAFDALALLAAGAPRAVAIFGVDGWRWEWARTAPALLFALDRDETGQSTWPELARQARLRGKRVLFLPEQAYGGCKDVAEAWQTGRLELGDWETLDAGERPQAPTAPPVTDAGRDWARDPRPELEHDGAAWGALLALAYAEDGRDPAGVFGVLHGLRCCGAGLAQDERGRYRLGPGEIPPAEYRELREEWLRPRLQAVRALLARLERAAI